MTEQSKTKPESLAGQMSDFSPKLSPMLVKELRQGTRTNMFSIAFILLHSFMILCLLVAMSNPTSDDSSAFFWFIITVILLFVQPLRGFSALSSEYQMNTMDLIQMTQLNGWRITLGKWTALNAQGMLFITGVLPYIVMRYFLGNIDIVMDLVGLLLVGIGSAFATAITVGCSVFQNIILRGTIVIALGIAFTSLFTIVTSQVFGRGAIGADQWFNIGILVVACIYGCFFFLSFGASRISPLAENHATRKRLVAIAAGLICALFLYSSVDESTIIIVCGIILGMSCIDAITEPLPIFSRVLLPFSKNPITQLQALYLSPGWISGLGFFLVCSSLFFGIFVAANFITGSNLIEDREDAVALISGFNLFVLPLIFIHLFLPKETAARFAFPIYVGVQAVIIGVTIMVAAIANAVGRWEDLIYTLLPFPSVLLFAYGDHSISKPHYLFIALGTTLLCLIVPLLRNRKSVGEFFTHLKPRS